MLTVNIIGAGKLGKTIAKLINLNNVATIQSVLNSSFKSSLQACEFIGQGTPCTIVNDLKPSDITLMALPDDKIKAMCHKILEASCLKQGSTILHCSGALSSSILNPAKKQYCSIASVHPMRSFADPSLSVSTYVGTFCAMEGDHDAVSLVQKIFNAIGSITYVIETDKKAIYHAAGVFASNYMVSLYQIASKCLEQAGVKNELSKQIILDLMQSTHGNLSSTKKAHQALTGPIKRGDEKTINSHLTAINDSEIKYIYVQLGKVILELTELSSEKKEKIVKLLDSC